MLMLTTRAHAHSAQGKDGHRGSVPSPYVVETVLRRCTQAEQGVWVEDVVVSLLRTGCVSAVACPDLISQALAKNSLVCDRGLPCRAMQVLGSLMRAKCVLLL